MSVFAPCSNCGAKKRVRKDGLVEKHLRFGRPSPPFGQTWRKDAYCVGSERRPRYIKEVERHAE